MVCGYVNPISGRWQHLAAVVCALAANIRYTWRVGPICYESGICPEV